MRCLPLAIIALTFALAPQQLSAQKRPETLTEQYDEKKMDEAMQKARDSFDKFATRFAAPQQGDKNFSVKVAIKDGENTEHMWLVKLSLKDNAYSGVINNEPGIVTNVKFNQRVTFTREDVSDWMYLSNGVMQGNHTLRVILESMPPEEAARIRKAIGW